ncbi:FAD-dependent oxidoreductase [Mesorhizobium sp.]|uniref:NAD(P)/FAD-dependent oxidoreductase n=1 Tax=Mesorhizobium sp. TaxID=1871066 RepID=UPI00345A5EDC
MDDGSGRSADRAARLPAARTALAAALPRRQPQAACRGDTGGHALAAPLHIRVLRAVDQATGCEDLLQKRGQLFVHETADGPSKGAYGLGLRREHGVKVDILDADEIRQLEPAWRRSFKSAVYLPEQGQCPNPGRLVARLAEHAARQGTLIIRAKVIGFDMGANGPSALRLVGGGRMPVETVALCAGAWSGDLARKLGDRIPLESERGYHIMVRGPKRTCASRRSPTTASSLPRR